MALKFFWRCEGTTLDATDDYYGSGDNTATVTGAGFTVPSATAAKIGSNGILAPASITGNAAFTATNLWPSASSPGASAGSFAFWFKVVSTWTTTDGLVLGLRCIGSTNNDAVRIQTDTVGNRISLALQTTGGGGTYELPVTSGTFAADTWYYVVGRWDYANDKAAIEVYTDAGGSTLAAFASASDIVTNLNPYIPATNFATLQCGAHSATQTHEVHSDHYIVSDNYDAPLENMAFITSATQYSESPLQAFQYQSRLNPLLRM